MSADIILSTQTKLKKINEEHDVNCKLYALAAGNMKQNLTVIHFYFVTIKHFCM